MESDKPPIHPHHTHYSLSAPPNPAPDPLTQPNDPDSNRFSYDLSRMSDLPARSVSGHRRAHSEILCLPDDLNFDSDLGVLGMTGDGPSFSDDTEEDLFSMYIDVEKFAASQSSASLFPPPQEESSNPNWNNGKGVSDKPRIRHQHSQSMDGSISIKPEMLTSGNEGSSSGGGSFAENKKSLSTSKLADLALVDPKRAKRIWANRQSAARSKERKMRYISELERKVQTLQTEATTLSTQLNMLRRDSSGLSAENHELKLRLHTVEQQVNLQDAVNDALRDEIQRLKVMTGQTNTGAGSMMNFGPSHVHSQPFYPSNHPMHSMLAAQQFQQLQIQCQQSQQQQQQQHHHQLQQQQQQQHQLQQHQHQHHQIQQQIQQQTGDLKLKGSLPSQSQMENPTDNNPSSNGLID